VTLFTGIAAIPLCQWVANRYGKKVATLGTLGLFFLWGAATWVVYNPAYPYLVLVTGVIHSIAGTAIWILIPSMTGDVVDHDELQTGQRREGSYAAVFSWTYKLSTTLGTAVSGLLVVWVGYDAALKIAQPPEVIHNMRLALLIVPVLFVCVAIYFMSRFPLGPTRVAENRRLLDKLRQSQSSVTPSPSGNP
jgi:GPH family glycoside/pentoside/hexuronide:cation symporter